MDKNKQYGGKTLTPKERQRIYEEVKAESKAKRDAWVNSEEGMDFEPIEDMDAMENPVPPKGMSKKSFRESMENQGDDLYPGYSKKKDAKYGKGKAMRKIKRIDDLRKRSKEFEKYGH